MRAKPASSISFTDSWGMRRASSAAVARSAKRGAMVRTRSMISSLVALWVGEGGMRLLLSLGCLRRRRRRQHQAPADREKLQIVALHHPAPNPRRRLEHHPNGDHAHQDQIDRAVVG